MTVTIGGVNQWWRLHTSLNCSIVDRPRAPPKYWNYCAFHRSHLIKLELDLPYVCIDGFEGTNEEILDVVRAAVIGDT